MLSRPTHPFLPYVAPHFAHISPLLFFEVGAFRGEVEALREFKGAVAAMLGEVDGGRRTASAVLLRRLHDVVVSEGR